MSELHVKPDHFELMEVGIYSYFDHRTPKHLTDTYRHKRRMFGRNGIEMKSYFHEFVEKIWYWSLGPLEVVLLCMKESVWYGP